MRPDRALPARPPSPEDRASSLQRLCRERGLRLTGPRLAVAAVLLEADDGPDAHEVHRRAARLDPEVSLSTVYRTIRLLETEGLLSRWSRGRGRARCEPVRDGGPRHRLVDVSTGAEVAFRDPRLDEALRALALHLGFRLVGQHLELFGLKDGASDTTASAADSVAAASTGPGSRRDDPRGPGSRTGGASPP